MWIHIIKITFRRLGLNKWDTFLSVCCLAVGIFCMGLAGYYSVVNNRYGREFPTSDRIAELYAPSAPYAEIAHEGYGLIGEDAFEAVTSYTSGWPIVFTVDEERNYRLSVCLADSAFFRVFPWKVVEGSLEQYGTPYTLVLTEGCVERYLGGRHVVGKSLFVRQYNQWYTVIAVVRDFPDGMFGGDVEAFCPALYDSYYHYSNLLLKDSSDTLMLNRRLREMDLTEVLEDMKVEGKKDLQVVLMKDRPRSNKMAFALLWIGVLVLAGALFNYYGFSLSRFMLRMRELHLRKVLGASSRGLFYFFVCRADSSHPDGFAPGNVFVGGVHFCIL